MGSLYKRQLNEWKASLDVKADVVFDIGGAQDPLKGMTKSWEVTDYKIIDLKEPHVLKQAPDIEHDMNKVWVGSAQADLIFCLGVFDYVINPNIAMDNIKKMLKDDGTAWVEYPLFYCIHNPIEDEGCRYSEGCIRRLAKQAGLKIVEMIYKPAGNPYLQEFFRQDGQRMAKGVDHSTVGYIVRFEHE